MQVFCTCEKFIIYIYIYIFFLFFPNCVTVNFIYNLKVNVGGEQNGWQPWLPPFGDLFSVAFSRDFFMVKAGEDLKETFLHSDSVLSTFPCLARPTSFPLSSDSWSCRNLLFGAPLAMNDPICADLPDPQLVTDQWWCSGGKTEQEDLTLWFGLLLIASSQ